MALRVVDFAFTPSIDFYVSGSTEVYANCNKYNLSGLGKIIYVQKI